MGVTLDLRIIDHTYVVVNGLVAVNKALAADDPAILVDYIASIPYEPDERWVTYRQTRVDRMLEMNAPDILLQHEEHMLRLANGEYYSRENLAQQSLDELRETLGKWEHATRSHSLDKAWDELDWFLQPGEGPDPEMPLLLMRPRVGDPSQTIFDQALSGSELSPLDDSGAPIIRTTGSEDCFGYNSPAKVVEIAEALSTVDVSKWDDLVPMRCELHLKDDRESDPDEIQECVADELDWARQAFQAMVRVYEIAMEGPGKLGVACEYTL